ncbi:MAG: hypothetical protein HYW45_02445 [Candidatus Daviesbacteria bacterium]|nr:MAG: hypothetical protein HYW45_02445 [Candidatus Daviesbacteria bacterium]
MIRKFSIIVTIFLGLIALAAYYLLPATPTHAQSASCTGSTPYRAEGLVAATSLSGKFNTSAGACVLDPKAAFFSFKIPSFDDLKVQYYIQANNPTITKHAEVASPANLPGGKIDLGSEKDHLYSFSDNVTITGNNDFPGNRSGVIFVSRDLNLGPLSSNKLDTSKNATGLVFVVGGNVNIDSTVTQIDAVIISSGTIYTAGGGCTTSSTSVSNTLTVNGSLVSLDETKPIKFCRKLLTSNQNPAEVVNWEGKYLAILNNLFASSFQKWSEIAGP